MKITRIGTNWQILESGNCYFICHRRLSLHFVDFEPTGSVTASHTMNIIVVQSTHVRDCRRPFSLIFFQRRSLQNVPSCLPWPFIQSAGRPAVSISRRLDYGWQG